jgi:predicted nucleic acid-binding Zn ribbon protein
VTEKPEAVPEHVSVYLRLRSVFGDPNRPTRDAKRRARSARDETSVPYGVGRDPRGLDDVLGALSSTMGWDSPLAQAELLASWPEIVGAETAGHTTPVGVEEGTLTVRCDSTAWAQQLRLMRATVMVRIEERHASAGITRVAFIGPDTPSWKRGPRVIPGRGPRDTYG